MCTAGTLGTDAAAHQPGIMDGGSTGPVGEDRSPTPTARRLRLGHYSVRRRESGDRPNLLTEDWGGYCHPLDGLAKAEECNHLSSDVECGTAAYVVDSSGKLGVSTAAAWAAASQQCERPHDLTTGRHRLLSKVPCTQRTVRTFAGRSGAGHWCCGRRRGLPRLVSCTARAAHTCICMLCPDLILPGRWTGPVRVGAAHRNGKFRPR